MKRILVTVTTLVAISGCVDPASPPSREQVVAGAVRESAVIGAAVHCEGCVVDTVFVRNRGTPVTESLHFDGDPAVEYRIEVQEIGPGANSRVFLNGETLLSPRTKGAVGSRSLRQSVSLDVVNVLRVELTGKPGSELVVRVIQVKAPVVSVGVTPSEVVLAAGASAQLTAVVADGTGQALTDRVVVWTSSDPSIASIDAGGRVSAMAPGSVTITATSEGVSGTALVRVTIRDLMLVHNTSRFWLLEILDRERVRVIATQAAAIREGDLHPDGDRVFYRTISASHSGVELRMSTGEQSSPFGEAWYPSYSSGGDSVIAGVTGPTMRVYGLRPTATQTDVPACSNGYPRWIDGDTKLLCATNVIWTFDLNSQEIVSVPFPRLSSWHPNEWLNCPRMSPDGTAITFYIELGVPGQYYMVDRDGGNLRPVGPSGSPGCHGSWAPGDGVFAIINGGVIRGFDRSGEERFSIPLPDGVGATNLAGWR